MDPEIGADRLRSGGAEAAPVPQAELTLCAPATTEALTPPPRFCARPSGGSPTSAILFIETLI